MKKEFDIEKWKKEHPLDYPQLIYFIEHAVDQQTIFSYIYQITRLYLPNVLFKYYSLTEDKELNEKKLQTLGRKEVYTSTIAALNDIFDSRAYLFDSERLSKYERGESGLFQNIKLNRVASFTANGVNSMPMWAHYSNNHKGYCVSYDMNNEGNIPLRGCMFPVQYSDKRIDITDILERQIKKVIEEIDRCDMLDIHEVVIKDLTIPYMFAFYSNIKHISWNYENEYRCTVASENISAVPNEIYIGARCNKEYQETLIELGNRLKIPVYLMMYDNMSKNFDLNAKLLN